MTSPADAIRARRKLTNRLIAAHDAARLRPFLYAQATMITGDGSLIVGAGAIAQAFAGQFTDPTFVHYLRTTGEVEVDHTGARAAEQGRWTALWRGPGGETTMAGTYLAVWRKVSGQWVIESELYVTLSESR